MRSAPRTLLTVGAVTVLLALSACTGDASDSPAPAPNGALDSTAGEVTPSPGDPVPAPTLSPGATPGTVATQPATDELAELAKTDLGQYLARPEGRSPAQVQAAVERLAGMSGVQSASVNEESLVDLVFLGSSTPRQRAAALQELAKVGEVLEGV